MTELTEEQRQQIIESLSEMEHNIQQVRPNCTEKQKEVLKLFEDFVAAHKMNPEEANIQLSCKTCDYCNRIGAVPWCTHDAITGEMAMPDNIIIGWAIFDKGGVLPNCPRMPAKPNDSEE